MSGFYKKAVVWLGLNEEYPDDVDAGSPGGSEGARHSPRPDQPAVRPSPSGQRPPADRVDRPEVRRRPEPGDGHVRQVPHSPRSGDPLRHNPTAPDRAESSVRAVPLEDTPQRAEHSPIGTVRAVAAPKTVKPKVIIPRSFNDAQVVADTFREPKPVIVNMQNAERDLARRLIDFSSGLCYGLGGQMEKVAKDVYLLTPDEVEVADEDRDAF